MVLRITKHCNYYERRTVYMTFLFLKVLKLPNTDNKNKKWKSAVLIVGINQTQIEIY